MEVSKAIKKIEKALGVKVEKLYENGPHHAKYTFHYGNHVGSFLTQQGYGDDAEGNYVALDQAHAMNWHIRRVDDHTDTMTDYFAGSFRDNCTQLIHAFKPPAAKFNVGDLVRGKQNKRAQRNGYAGKTALVVATGGGSYFNIDFLGQPKRAYNSFPERDFEVVAAAA